MFCYQFFNSSLDANLGATSSCIAAVYDLNTVSGELILQFSGIRVSCIAMIFVISVYPDMVLKFVVENIHFLTFCTIFFRKAPLVYELNMEWRVSNFSFDAFAWWQLGCP